MLRASKAMKTCVLGVAFVGSSWLYHPTKLEEKTRRSYLESCSKASCSSAEDFRKMMESSGGAVDQNILPSWARTREHCPVDKDELGRSSWTLLHTMAAVYPDHPTKEQQNAALQILHGLSLLYPCEYCRIGLEEDMKENPPNVTSRESFQKWLCRHHNLINSFQDKPQFPCNTKALDARWRTGHPACTKKKN